MNGPNTAKLVSSLSVRFHVSPRRGIEARYCVLASCGLQAETRFAARVTASEGLSRACHGESINRIRTETSELNPHELNRSAKSTRRLLRGRESRPNSHTASSCKPDPQWRLCNVPRVGRLAGRNGNGMGMRGLEGKVSTRSAEVQPENPARWLLRRYLDQELQQSTNGAMICSQAGRRVGCE
jgi:hypothetical protein